MAPQQPPPPEIEGFLKKFKRKTSNLSGSWNKRWFFVDPKRREFGYAKTKAPGAPKSSIYLNDITVVVQFDDTHFQVESRTHNFFLCGESKTSTTCWVKSLDEYQKKMAEYEKEKARYDAIVQSQMLPPDAKTEVASSTQSTKATARKATPSSNNKGLASGSSQSRPSGDEPSRDSFSSSSSSSSGSSVSSSSSKRATERQARVKRRSPSPAETPPKEKRRDRERTSGDKKNDRSRERDHDHRDRDRDRGREREKDRSRERERGCNERSPSASSKSRSKPSAGSHTNSRLQFENRSIGDASSVRAHPGKGYVMQAWPATIFKERRMRKMARLLELLFQPRIMNSIL